MKVSKTATPDPIEPDEEENFEELDEPPVEEPEDLETAPEDDEESAEPAEDEESEPAEAEDEADDQADEPAADEAAPQEPQSASEEPIATEPFRFRADGQDVDVPGAFSAEFGIVIPHAAWKEHVQPHLADRTQWRRKEAEYQRRIDTLTETHPDVIKARVLSQKIDALMKDPDTFYAFYEDFERNKKVFELEMEVETTRAASTARSQQETAVRSQQSQEEIVGLMDSGMKAGLQHVLREDEFAGAGLDLDELHENLWNHPLRNNFYFRAKANDGSGLEPGTLGINLDALRHHLRPMAKRVGQARKDVAKVASAAKRNAAAVSKPKAPPAVSGRGTETPNKVVAKEPETPEEWHKQLKAAARS